MMAAADGTGDALLELRLRLSRADVTDLRQVLEASTYQIDVLIGLPTIAPEEVRRLTMLSLTVGLVLSQIATQVDPEP